MAQKARPSLSELNSLLGTVRGRIEQANERMLRLEKREQELLADITAERKAVQAELDAADAALEG